MKLSIRQIAPAALLAAAAIVVPAQAARPAGQHGQSPQHGGKSHKCRSHAVAWIVRGTVVSQTLAPNGDGTYSGDVTVQVSGTNHNARAEKGQPQPKTYTLTGVKVTFGVTDQAPADGTVDQTDVVAGDQVKLVGKITTLAKKCDRSGFTARTSVRRVIFNDPPSTADSNG
jgi:hypothetical protein